MNKHTPGPWFYRRGDEWSHSVVTIHGGLPDGSPNCWEIASINTKREPEHVANAHLIAAAPDLLDALETLAQMDVKGHQLQDRLQFTDKGRAILKKVRDAIAKARGEE